MNSQKSLNLLNFYYAALVVGFAFYVMYWFAPWSYHYLSPEMQDLLSWGGYESWFVLPDLVFKVLLFAVSVSYIGMWFFKRSFRRLFLIMVILNLILSIINGAVVVTSIEVFVIDASTVLSGFILGLAYFSPLEDKFY